MMFYFRVQALFTAPIGRPFWRKFLAHQEPFSSLAAVGGTTHGYFYGTIQLDLPLSTAEDVLAYHITEALVQKVELFSDVGVEHLEFEEITRGVKGAA